jgi:hypothetical protein
MKTPWEDIHARFDPAEPVPIEHKDWRVARKYSPADSLKVELNRPFGDKRFLIIGTVGTGKSTELYQLAESRTEREFVVVVDLWQFFEGLGDADALNHIQPWEVVFLIGLHVFQAAQAQGHTWSKERIKALETARRKFDEADASATLSVPKLAAAVTVMVGGLLGGAPAVGAGAIAPGLAKIAGSGDWNVPLGRRTRALDQDERVKGLLAAVNALIGELNGRGRRVACFIDGLDRVREFATVKSLFVESSLLGKLACTTVLTGPILVRRRGLGGVMRTFDVKVLANVPVLQQGGPTVVTEVGAHFFTEAWRVRTQELGAVDAIPTDQLKRLAWASGGRARQFVKMIREVAEASYDAGLDVSTDAIIEAVIDQQRRDLELGINRADVALLRSVLEDHALPEGDRVVDLLESFWLLPYPNESEWYHPHPLLMLNKLAG